MSERKTVQVELRVYVLCDVEVSGTPYGDEFEIHSIELAQQGNIQSMLNVEVAGLSDDEYAAIDEAAMLAFQKDAE